MEKAIFPSMTLLYDTNKKMASDFAIFLRETPELFTFTFAVEELLNGYGVNTLYRRKFQPF